MSIHNRGFISSCFKIHIDTVIKICSWYVRFIQTSYFTWNSSLVATQSSITYIHTIQEKIPF